MAFSFKKVCVVVLLVLIEIGFVINEGTTQNLRPEYIHPEGAEDLDTYSHDFHHDDPDDPEDDYIPLPDHHETLDGLPIFLIEPKNSYAIKNKPASLLCRAANALQVYFKCNEARVETSQFEHVDPHDGVRVVEAEVNVTKDKLDEFFGDDGYECECVAWNSRGSITSERVVVEFAYIKKQFITSPQSSSVEQAHSATFRCVPPSSAPPSTLKWMRNGVPVGGDETLVIERVSLQDMGNYTCVAENIAGRRESEPAVLTVYVNGGWSDWSPWAPCHCGGTVSGRRRTRGCTEPAPVNDGAPCRGPAVMKSDDCVHCQNAGIWSLWGDWSSCAGDCVRVRRRQCTGACSGPAVQHAACVDGLCSQPFFKQNTPILIGIGIMVAILTASVAVLYVWCRNRRIRPGYTMARTGTPKSCSSRDKTGPDLTRSCNSYWMHGVDNHYDMPNVRDSYSSPLGSAARSNHYEMKPYSPSGDSASSCCTYTRTMTSQSSGSTEAARASPRVDVAVTLPPMPLDSSYRDNICLTVVK